VKFRLKAEPLVPAHHTVPAVTAFATTPNKDLVYFYLLLKKKANEQWPLFRLYFFSVIESYNFMDVPELRIFAK